jgi:hypothetical protein
MRLNSLLIITVTYFLISCSKEENDLSDDTNNPISSNPQFEITYDNQIINSFNSFAILKIIKKNDGFIFFSNELITMAPFNTGIRISKLDNQLNLVWTFLIDETPESEHLGGVLELANDEFIAILSKMNYTNTGINNNEVYGLKINNSGNILWQKDYSANNVDLDTHLDDVIEFKNESNELKIMFRSDSTYYNSNDFYFREVKLNSDGQVLSNTKLNYTDVNQFYNIIYDKNGNKYNFGGRLLVDFFVGNASYNSYDASLIKYNIDNQVVFDKTYGIQRIDDFFHNILIDNNNKSIVIGTCGIDASNNTTGRWIKETNHYGNVVWEIKEFKEDYVYFGKDIIQDNDGNYLSLFNDINGGFNIATLIKSNSQGTILWKFEDGLEGNADSFVPYKVFKNNDEYLLFGLKDEKIWLKKIRVY